MEPLAIFVALRPSLYEQIFTPESDMALRNLGRVSFYGQEHPLSAADLARHLSDCEVVVTGWGVPTFGAEVLQSAGRLKLIAHTAGSIKAMLPAAVFERGIAVTHAAGAIAPAVAELSLMLTLLMLRQAPRRDRLLRERGWQAARDLPLGEELAGQPVGVVGAGYTGRCFIRLLRALDADVWVYDPYLSDERAAALGVRKADLHSLLASCRVVSLQAPPTPATRGMIGARELRALQDGAILINTARGALVEHDALLAELRSGRIYAALDVFDQEPLPADSPLRELPNVFLTPHIAGASLQARRRQGAAMVEEIRRFAAGAPLQWPVTVAMLDTMA